MLMASPAPAQDINVLDGSQVAALERGDRAPFPGILLSDDSVASLKARLDTSDRECQIKIDHQTAISDADIMYEKETAASRLQLCKETAAAKLEVRDAELEMLAKRLEEAEKARANGQLLFGGGVIAGIGLTVLAGWAIGQAAN